MLKSVSMNLSLAVAIIFDFQLFSAEDGVGSEFGSYELFN